MCVKGGLWWVLRVVQWAAAFAGYGADHHISRVYSSAVAAVLCCAGMTCEGGSGVQGSSFWQCCSDT
jgi:hypothetical protein